MAAQELWFKYEKDLPDVVKGLSLELHKGEFLALLGGNGTGKTTTLKLLANLKKPHLSRRACHHGQRRDAAPESAGALCEIHRPRRRIGDFTKTERKSERLRTSFPCKLAELLDRHPYDLSGGEQQRAALAKILLLNPGHSAP